MLQQNNKTMTTTAIKLTDGFGNISTMTFTHNPDADTITSKWISDNGIRKSFKPYFNIPEGESPFDGDLNDFMNEIINPMLDNEVPFARV